MLPLHYHLTNVIFFFQVKNKFFYSVFSPFLKIHSVGFYSALDYKIIRSSQNFLLKSEVGEWRVNAWVFQLIREYILNLRRVIQIAPCQIHSCRLVILSCCGAPTDKTGRYLWVPSSKGRIRWVKVCIYSCEIMSFDVNILRPSEYSSAANPFSLSKNSSIQTEVISQSMKQI